jgi:ribonuclease BN (tRNA processing enzyme)
VLALDRPGMLDAALARQDFEPGAAFSVGPFDLRTALLPHFTPNAAVRCEAGGRAIVYTGDGGPDPALVELARGTDTLIAEATHPEVMQAADARYLSTGRQAARQAAEAGVGRLVLTHLWPGVESGEYLDAAAKEYDGRTCLALGGLSFDA